MRSSAKDRFPELSVEEVLEVGNFLSPPKWMSEWLAIVLCMCHVLRCVDCTLMKYSVLTGYLEALFNLVYKRHCNFFRLLSRVDSG